MNAKSLFVALVGILCLSFAPLVSNTVYATINGYLGSGYFSTGNLRWCHVGSQYAAESQNAVNRWSVDTDLNLSTNCSGTHVYTKYASYGNTGWSGYAYICNVWGQCDSAAWSSTYQSCEARLNATAISGSPSAEVQKLATHELGHCWSLDHANTSSSVMSGASVPGTQDINLVNARY